MTRLIDADALETHEMYDGQGFTQVVYKDDIDNAPTVSFMISPDYVTELQNLNKELVKQLEQAERPQGKWIDYTGLFLECDQCQFKTVFWGRFCPNCGADMRKEADNDD